MSERVPQTIGELGEDALIEIFAADRAVPSARLIVPNGDDAAAFVLEPKYAAVVTTDTLVEGVHFDLGYGRPLQVGRKLMAVNLSDLAAMGARPKYALISVALPEHMRVEVAQQIAAGIREHGRAHMVPIIGGNTARTSGPIVLSATLIGRAEPDELIRRRGTQHGDALFVTGSLGHANAGLRLARMGHREPHPEHPYASLWSSLLDPIPRVAAGRALAKLRLVHAMCDVSDGLGRDIGRLLRPEGLGARLEGHRLPISPTLREFASDTGAVAEAIALEGGEDYELLFSADPDDEKEIVRVLTDVATPVTRIGTVTAGPEIEVFMPDGSVIAPPAGFDHFARRKGKV